ncbi:MAG: nitroreductase [Streptosporangiales bacterium]|nr:nitroreductase [Streptosporangiales bacterium]
MDTAVTDHLLSTTRAVRRRLDLGRPVEREVILDCVRLAVQAPTGSNRQNWRWVVVTDPDTRARLAELYRSGGSSYLRRQLEAHPSGQNARVFSSAQYLLEVLHRVPVLVIPCVEGGPSAPTNRGAAPFYGSILPAVWSFMLALRSRGLGSAWTTFHLAHEREAAEILGIPEGITQVALIPVAYAKGDDFKPARRRPVEEITYWDRWNATP